MAPCFHVELVKKSGVDESLLREIDVLAARTAEPNVFYESWMLGPALLHLSAPELHLAMVRDDGGNLAGLFPFERTRYRNSPLWSLRSWKHDYVFLCTPLVAAGQEGGVVAALLDWVSSGAAPCSILDLIEISDDGPFAAAVGHVLGERPGVAVRSLKYERALLQVEDEIADTGISGKHLKELRRLERRLAEDAPLAYRALGTDEPAGPWVERFLALESRGWKGREQTAISCHEGSRAFFIDVATHAHARSRLHMLELVRGDEVVASKCNFLGGCGSFSFKIAYDERYAKYSPGVLLELFNVRHLSEGRGDVKWMDSCAKQDHPMINRVWLGRRGIVDHSIAGRGFVARGVVRHGHRIKRALASMRVR